jgi:hypothetical protein
MCAPIWKNATLILTVVAFFCAFYFILILYLKNVWSLYAMWHPLSTKVSTIFADKQQLLGWYSSLVDSGHGVFVHYTLNGTVQKYIYI